MENVLQEGKIRTIVVERRHRRAGALQEGEDRRVEKRETDGRGRSIYLVFFLLLLSVLRRFISKGASVSDNAFKEAYSI